MWSSVKYCSMVKKKSEEMKIMYFDKLGAIARGAH